jgi:branched-subunit amino acid transport protein
VTGLELALCICAMAAVTLGPRVLPLCLLAGRDLPPAFARCLEFVPVSVLAALLAPELLIRDGGVALGDNVFLAAAAPTFVAAWRTRGFFGPIAVGMATVAACRLLGWN